MWGIDMRRSSLGRYSPKPKRNKASDPNRKVGAERFAVAATPPADDDKDSDDS